MKGLQRNDSKERGRETCVRYFMILMENLVKISGYNKETWAKRKAIINYRTLKKKTEM